MKWKDFSKLIKFRLTFLVVFSASVTFLIGSKAKVGIHGAINWKHWGMLIIGGFLVTSAANCFNEIIEKDYDKLMKRTKDRPIPSGHMTTGQALILGLVMAIGGTYLLGSINLATGYVSVFSILLYAFAYTPLKRVSPIPAVLVGAVAGALPPFIGYLAGYGKVDQIALIVFGIQFVWQLPHFWAIAWVLDDDYKLAGFRLLPTGNRDLTSAIITFISTIILVPVSLLPTIYHYGGYWVGGVSLVCGLVFLYLALMLLIRRDIKSAQKLMFGSFFYLPIVQLMFLFDFLGK
jgi:protoheme IX farnesyltransferase